METTTASTLGTTTSPTTATGDSPVALAFAVAALQSGDSPLDVTSPESSLPSEMTTPQVPQSSSSSSSTNAESSETKAPASMSVKKKKASLKSHQQAPGSGSQESPVVLSNDDDQDHNTEELARLAKSRERNREHARKTRLRKKAQMETLQSTVKGLQAERLVLQQRLQDCQTAFLLLGLEKKSTPASSPLLWQEEGTEESSTLTQDVTALLASNKRKRFVPASLLEEEDHSNHHDNNNNNNHSNNDQQHQHVLTLVIQGQETVVGGRAGCHINWKTGMYSDEVAGTQQQLTPQQLQTLRYVVVCVCAFI